MILINIHKVTNVHNTAALCFGTFGQGEKRG